MSTTKSPTNDNTARRAMFLSIITSLYVRPCQRQGKGNDLTMSSKARNDEMQNPEPNSEHCDAEWMKESVIA